MSRHITPLLEPASVAVVGASSDPQKAGGALFGNIVRGGFPGPLYPINPRATEILGCRAFAGIDEVPDRVDLAFIVVSRQLVLPAAEACARRGVRAAVIVTAGFGEAGAQGAAEQQRLAELARERGLRLAGPNTIGLVSMPARLVATIVPFDHWQDGPIAIYAQTGVFAGAPTVGLMAEPYQRLGVRVSLDVGNKCDVDEVDFLRWAGSRADVRVIGLHLESIRDPGAFLAEATQVKQEKPVVILKPGRTAAGALAAASHTGALAGDDRIFEAGLRQFGLVRAYDFDEFVAFLKAFACQPVPVGGRLGIVSYSGGLGAIATDEAIESGLELAEWTPATRARLRQLAPDWQPVGNPVDLLPVVAGPDGQHAHEEAVLDAVLGDANTDAVLAIMLAVQEPDLGRLRRTFADLRARHPDKPLFLIVYGGAGRARWLEALDAAPGVSIAPSSRVALRALAALRCYGAARTRRYVAADVRLPPPA